MTRPPPLLVRFRVDLEPEQIDESFRPHGALFHRWLPDGPDDALKVPTGHPGTTIRYWFERLGFSNPGEDRIYFARNRREVDERLMVRQAILDSGPLHGELRTESWSEDEHGVVTSGATGSAAYIAIAKRLVDGIVIPLTRRFIRVLQVDFGQYWLAQLHSRDSGSASLGAYCSHLQMCWRRDGTDDKWQNFLPTSRSYSATATNQSGFHHYLRPDDWRSMPERVSSSAMDDDCSVELLLRSRLFEDLDGDLSLALIEAATAGEVLVERVVRNYKKNSTVTDSMPGLAKLTASERFFIVARLCGGVEEARAALGARVWGLRNKVVHRGWRPSETEEAEARDALDALCLAMAQLLDRQSPRLVTAFPMNAWAEPDVWDKQEDTASRPQAHRPGALFRV